MLVLGLGCGTTYEKRDQATKALRHVEGFKWQAGVLDDAVRCDFGEPNRCLTLAAFLAQHGECDWSYALKAHACAHGTPDACGAKFVCSSETASKQGSGSAGAN